MLFAIKLRRFLAHSALVSAATIGALCFTGCERKETILDVQTPGADVEVERNVDTGEIDVEATDKD